MRKLILLLCALCFVGANLHVGSRASAQVDREGDLLAITLTDDQLANALHGLPVLLTPAQIAAIQELIGAEPATLGIPMGAFLERAPLAVMHVPVRYVSK